MKDTPIKNVINEYNGRVRSTIKGFFKNSIDDDEVDDIEQTVYIKTWKNFHKVENSTSLLGWIKTVTINTCKDFTKSKKAFACSDEEMFNQIKDNKPIPLQKALLNERHQTIINAINLLPPKFKEVVILHDIEELTHDAIAKKLNCPAGTIKSRLFKARRLLKEELKEFL
ncbi:MAG: sigma-70 family RNA polymerase sigma factor [bacterium]